MLTTIAHTVTACAVRTRYCTIKENRSVQTELARRLTMRLLVLCLILWGTIAKAEPPPPVPEGGLTHLDHGVPCTDPVTGLQGKCFHSLDRQNNYYIAFYTFGDLCMYIMQKVDGEYKELWRRSADT